MEMNIDSHKIRKIQKSEKWKFMSKPLLFNINIEEY